ncbi:MAG TPA: MFS transporter [Syntrophorhabdaceae bacterium]|nr:MFS transporter [Syntrophorhabdaceae bacterium]
MNNRIFTMLLLGFSSGLPLPLTSGTLQAWLTVAGIDLKTIGLFSLVSIPYTVKFLWSPVMDRFVPPWLGRRRGWILPIQIVLMVFIFIMGSISPENAPFLLAVLAFSVAFISASQDIVIDAYRTDVLTEKERGIGAATFITGYRIAMLIAGAVALILSESLGWQITYWLMAILMAIGVLGIILGKEPDSQITPPKTIEEAVWGPLKDIFNRKNALLILFFIILYKLGDAYAGALTTAFLIRGVNFSPTEVGTINKGMGLVATIVGAMFGGTLMIKMGLYRSLMFFGILQMISNLSFMLLALTGKSYLIMIFSIAFENITGGMGSAAFLAFVMAICNKQYSATQYALLSSLAALGRVFISPTSGYIVAKTGWPVFFLFTTITALPGLILLWNLKNIIYDIQNNQKS